MNLILFFSIFDDISLWPELFLDFFLEIIFETFASDTVLKLKICSFLSHKYSVNDFIFVLFILDARVGPKLIKKY